MNKLNYGYESSASIKPLLILFIVTVLSQLAYPIYAASVSSQAITPLLLPSLLFISALTIPSLVIGSRLNSKTSANCHLITPPTRSGLQFAILSGVALGATLLILRLVLQPYLPEALPAYGFRGVTGGLLVSLGAAIAEEVWFRYGLLTLVFYAYLTLTKTERLSQISALVLIILVAFVFGLAHLPQLLSFGAGSLFAIWATILGNVAVGILYGWCFWRYGLFTAIIAHFTLDLVLHMLPAMV